MNGNEFLSKTIFGDLLLMRIYVKDVLFNLIFAAIL
jgi:hypothetical protein